MRTGEVCAIIALGIVTISFSSVWLVAVGAALLYAFGVKLPLPPSVGVGTSVAIGVGIVAIYSPCFVSLGYLTYFVIENRWDKSKNQGEFCTQPHRLY